MPEALLEVRALDAYYGDFQALFGVSLQVAAGEIVAVIGANGAGKSTLLKSIAGLMRSRRDAIILAGEPVGDVPAHAMAARGVALVPEGRRLFPSLTVEENLRDRRPARPARAVEPAARLRSLSGAGGAPRRAQHSLSGGQQQMVAIGRALMSNPQAAAVRRDQPRAGADRGARDLRPAAEHPARRGYRSSSSSRTSCRRSRPPTTSTACRRGGWCWPAPPRTLTREAISAAYFGV